MFVIVIWPLVGSYLLFSFDEVRLVLTGARSAEVVERGQVLTAIVQQVGLFALLALIGLVFAAREARNYLELAQRKLHTRLFFVLVLFGLVLTFPLLQLYHLLTANLHDLWKHNLYTLVLIARSLGQTDESHHHLSARRRRDERDRRDAARLLPVSLSVSRRSRSLIERSTSRGTMNTVGPIFRRRFAFSKRSRKSRFIGIYWCSPRKRPCILTICT